MELTCKNCQYQFEGHYCPQCGQKFISQRFKLKDSISWAFHSIFNFDKGFLHTSLALITSPGKVILEFLDGITVRYAHPFRFVFIWATIYTLIGVYFGLYEDTSIAYNEAMGMSEEQIQSGQKVRQFLGQYMSFVTLSMIPLISLASSWLFKSKKLHYAEHLIINSYAQASSMFISLPILFLYPFIHEIGLITPLNLVVSIIVITRIYGQVFKTNYLVAGIKYIFVFIINILLFAVVMIVLVFIIAIVSKLLGLGNPFVAQ